VNDSDTPTFRVVAFKAVHKRSVVAAVSLELGAHLTLHAVAYRVGRNGAQIELGRRAPWVDGGYEHLAEFSPELAREIADAIEARLAAEDTTHHDEDVTS